MSNVSLEADVAAEKRIRTSANVQKRARELRRMLPPAESRLWDRLRNRRLGGLKFRRQHPLGPFIADFYCAEHRLVVELDGDIHDFQAEQDYARTHQSEAYGYKVIRFRNDEVEQDIDKVLSGIFNACHPCEQAKVPLPESGEGQG